MVGGEKIHPFENDTGPNGGNHAENGIVRFGGTRGGCVLNATISRYVYGTLVPKSERSIGFRSFDYGTVVYWTHEEHLQFDGQMDLVKGVLKRFELDKFRTEGFDLFVHADAPPGSGLGSSSTFTV